MRKQPTTFERMNGTRPDAERVQELKQRISSAVPEVVKAVRNRERLAASSRYRELDTVKGRKPKSVTPSEDVHTQP